MKRRTLLSAGAGAGIAAVSGFPALAQGRRQLRMVTAWPKNAPGPGLPPERLAVRVAEATDGALTIKVYGAGELVPPFEIFDTVASGAADMYNGPDFYWQGKSKAYNFFAAVPFGLTAEEMNAWIYHSGGQALWDELSAGFNIKPFLCGNSGPQMGGWYRREINSLEDLKGLKIRIPGLGGEVMRRVGAVAVNIPGSELFQALQSGAVDAAEWGTPWDDLALGFHKVAKNYYYPGFQEPGTAITTGINLDVWNDLSRPHRALIEAACTAENVYTAAEFRAHASPSLKIMTERHGVTVRRFSDDILTALGAAAGEVLAEAAASDPMTARVFDSFMAARRDAMSWAATGEQAYGRLRALPFPYG